MRGLVERSRWSMELQYHQRFVCEITPAELVSLSVRVRVRVGIRVARVVTTGRRQKL